MRLERVTITGADDRTDVADLEALSAEFPFVEWAILVSASHGHSPRWPGPEWQDNFSKVAMKSKMAASCHVCGRWVADIMAGYEAPAAGEDEDRPGGAFGLSTNCGQLLRACQRVQFNFHGHKHGLVMGGEKPSLLDEIDYINFWSGKKQFIFQSDGVNDEICELAAKNGVDAVPLFDCSHGAGVLPAEWPKARLSNKDGLVCHGYAGGLGPDTLEEQLPRIFAAAGDARIWVDMETRVRTQDDEFLDMQKVRRCLEICSPYVSKK